MTLEILPARTLRVIPSHLSGFRDDLATSSRPLRVSRERIMDVARRSGDTYLWHVEPNTPYQQSTLLRTAMDAAHVPSEAVLAHGVLGLIYVLRRAFLQNPDRPIRGVTDVRFTAPVFEGAEISATVDPERDGATGFEVIRNQPQPGLVITGRILYGPIADRFDTSQFSSLAEQQLFSLEEALGALSALIGLGVQENGGYVLYMGQRLELRALATVGDELEPAAEIVDRRPGKRAGERIAAETSVRNGRSIPIAGGESIFLYLHRPD